MGGGGEREREDRGLRAERKDKRRGSSHSNSIYINRRVDEEEAAEERPSSVCVSMCKIDAKNECNEMGTETPSYSPTVFLFLPSYSPFNPLK